MSKRTTQRVEEIVAELEELEVDQHPFFHKHESKGRERTAFLLLELNTIEESERVSLQLHTLKK